MLKNNSLEIRVQRLEDRIHQLEYDLKYLREQWRDNEFIEDQLRDIAYEEAKNAYHDYEPVCDHESIDYEYIFDEVAEMIQDALEAR